MLAAAVRRSVAFSVLAVSWLSARANTDSRLDELSSGAMRALSTQDYETGIRLLSEGAKLARQGGAVRRAALFENAKCGAAFFAMQYGASLRACAEAISLAKEAGDSEVMGVAELNRSNSLLSMGDWNGARLGLERAMKLLSPGSSYRGPVLAALGGLESRRGRWAESRLMLHQAVEITGASPDRRTEAYAWSVLGELELRAGRLDDAERALLAAFRLRKLHRLPQLESTWTQLGYLELARGRPRAALDCFRHGLEVRRTSKAYFTSFVTAQGRAEALRLMGRKAEAWAAYKQAFAESFAWRTEIAPSEGLEIAADVRLSQVVSGLIESCEGDEAHEWEAFASLESARAAGLRRQILTNRTLVGRLTGQHLELIREARQLGLRVVHEEPGALESLKLIEAKLTQLEAQTLAIPAGAGWGGVAEASWPRLSRLLSEGHALITFWTGERGSRVWVLTRGLRASAPLPGAAELRRLVEAQREALGRGAGEEESARLYQVLFGGIPRTALAAPHWQIVADGPLWSMAWAALRPPGEAGVNYLIQSKTLEFLPSAAWLMQNQPRPVTALMVAAGDAVHNRADPRLGHATAAGSAAPLSFWVWPRPLPQPEAASLELPTLAGSARELDLVCEVWGQADCRAVRGVDLTADRLASELLRRPAVVHLATHLVEVAAPDDSQGGEAFLALSLNSMHEREGFWTAGVSRLQAPGALIVLSACGSVRGKVLPGAGLQGFGRAWLAAGARGAIGTLWSVRDSEGMFFKSFYSELRGGASAANALRTSQIKAIKEGGWRAQPRSWAAYTIIGKD